MEQALGVLQVLGVVALPLVAAGYGFWQWRSGWLTWPSRRDAAEAAAREWIERAGVRSLNR